MFEPKGSFLLVRPVKMPEGRITINSEDKHHLLFAEVVKVGPGRTTLTGVHEQMDWLPGDIIAYPQGAGHHSFNQSKLAEILPNDDPARELILILGVGLDAPAAVDRGWFENVLAAARIKAADKLRQSATEMQRKIDAGITVPLKLA